MAAAIAVVAAAVCSLPLQQLTLLVLRGTSVCVRTVLSAGLPPLRQAARCRQ